MTTRCATVQLMKYAAENIAIVKLGAIGDAVNALPFVNRLRDGCPRARITWIIGPLAHSLLAGHRAVDEFLIFDSKRASSWPGFVRDLRRRRFDLVIDLQRILKSGVITRASGAPLRLGFDRARCKEGAWLFVNRSIPPNPRSGVTLEQYLEFADFLELPSAPIAWNVPYEPFASNAQDLARVVVNLGASKPANRWDAERWAELCDRLARESGLSVHITGGREDRATAEMVAALSTAKLCDDVGRLTLKQTAGLIHSARMFIGCDTGPLHIAAALGTPCVALFGASDPARTGPFGQARGVVTHAVPCSPCRRKICNVHGHPCMRDLSVELVWTRVEAELARTRTTTADR